MMISESFQTFRNACDTSTETFKKLESLYSSLMEDENPTLSESRQMDFEIVFSQKIIAFYETIPGAALSFVASFITELFERQFSAPAKKKKKNLSFIQLESWEHVLRVIVIGLETYSASHPQKHSQLGEVLYKPLFTILSSIAGLKFSTRLKIEMFGLLSDLAQTSFENKKLLREKDILGGPRLGMLISSTKEYLVLVILLQLLESVILLNENEGAVMDMAKSVFQNRKIKRSLKQTSPELIKILQEAGNIGWDLTADRLIRAMAAADAEKPQPFLLASPRIRANDKTFSHPETLRYIYMDNGALIVNIEDEDGIDCLDIALKSIISMSLKEISASSKVEISLKLSSPPMMATQAVPSKTNNSHAVIFEINLVDLNEFKAALKHRGLDELAGRLGTRPSSKQSVANEPLNMHNISRISLEEKSLAVEKFYRTSTPEPMVSHEEAVCEAKFPETDMTAFTSNDKSASSPPNHLSEEEGPLYLVHGAHKSVEESLINNNGNHKELRTLQDQNKLLVDDGHKLTLKRKRSSAEINESNPKSKPNEGPYYNSQFLTKQAPISKRQYKARRRILSSGESSTSEDDIIPLASPIHIDDPKHLTKLNTDRPERLILPTTSKTRREVNLKAAPPHPPILGKLRPKPKPKRRKFIEESDSDGSQESPVLLFKETSNVKMIVKKTTSPENYPYPTPPKNKMNVYGSPNPQTTLIQKPAFPVAVEASSPFKSKDLIREFLDNEVPAQDVEMDVSEELNAFDDSDREDDMDKSLLSLRAGRRIQDSLNLDSTLVHDLSRTRKDSQATVLPPLKSALKSVTRSVSSIIDLTHLADSPRNNNVNKCSSETQIQLNLNPADNTINIGDPDTGLADTSNAASFAAQPPAVPYKEYPAEIKDLPTDPFSRPFVIKPDTNEDSHISRPPSTPLFKNVSKRMSKEVLRVPYIIDNRALHHRSSRIVLEDVESSSSQDEILTSEQRLVNVLNKIHATIVENLGKKIKGPNVVGNALSSKFRLYAAEELERMLQESIKHRQNMVVLEHKYGTYHKNLKGGLEDIRTSNQEIIKTLEQVVQDHDTLSLVRKMPTRLAAPPKFF